MIDKGSQKSILALDVGQVRIGVALIKKGDWAAHEYLTLLNDEQFEGKLKNIIDEFQISEIIVGNPRNIDSNETVQTRYVQNFARLHLEKFKLPLQFVDEFLSSHQAKLILEQTKKTFTKADIDKVAARIILEDYLNSLK
jgi:putative Holliday junction resolvase